MLLALAEELGTFVEFVGGAEHAHVLLPALGVLAGVEESVVRDKAVESIVKVAELMPAPHYDTHLFPLIKRLADDESFTSRASAPPLFAIANPKLSDARKTSLKQ